MLEVLENIFLKMKNEIYEVTCLRFIKYIKFSNQYSRFSSNWDQEQRSWFVEIFKTIDVRMAHQKDV